MGKFILSILAIFSVNSDGHDMRVKLYDPNGNTVYNKVRVNFYFQNSKFKNRNLFRKTKVR
jgi:hypothetical protein